MTPTPNVPAMTSEREALAQVLYDALSHYVDRRGLWQEVADAILAAGFRRSADALFVVMSYETYGEETSTVAAYVTEAEALASIAHFKNTRRSGYYVEKVPLARPPNDNRAALAEMRETLRHMPICWVAGEVERVADMLLAAGFRRSSPGWIACSERMPESEGKYLVYSPRWGEVDTLAFTEDLGFSWVDGDGTLVPFMPTHWMPLPAPPSDTDKAREEGEGT
jgi:hypothetical protein